MIYGEYHRTEQFYIPIDLMKKYNIKVELGHTEIVPIEMISESIEGMKNIILLVVVLFLLGSCVTNDTLILEFVYPDEGLKKDTL